MLEQENAYRKIGYHVGFSGNQLAFIEIGYCLPYEIGNLDFHTAQEICLTQGHEVAAIPHRDSRHEIAFVKLFKVHTGHRQMDKVIVADFHHGSAKEDAVIQGHIQKFSAKLDARGQPEGMFGKEAVLPCCGCAHIQRIEIEADIEGTAKYPGGQLPRRLYTGRCFIQKVASKRS